MRFRVVPLALVGAICCIPPVLAEDYGRVNLVHANGEGFQTTISTSEGVERFIVHNGSTQFILERDLSLGGPAIAYVNDGENTTLSVTSSPLTKMDCTGYWGKRADISTGRCSTPCTGCYCEECKVTLGSNLGVLDLGPGPY